MALRAPLLACVAVATAGCTSATRSTAGPAPRSPGPPLTYVAVGGNESLGYDADDPSRQGWTQLFYQKALPPAATFYDLAESGATTVTALSDQVPEAMALHPDVVTVWLSLSDLLAGEPADAYQAQLDQVVHRLRGNGATKVLVATTPPLGQLPGYQRCVRSPQQCRPDLQHLPSPATAAALAQAYNTAIARVAADQGAVVVDVHAAMARALARPSGSALTSTDDLDLSTGGHALVAGLFASALTRSGGARYAPPSRAPVTALQLPAPRYEVGVVSEPFVDRSRPTPANNPAPALPTRSLPTLVLYPAKGPPAATDQPGATVDGAAGPYPLLVFAHGLDSSGSAYEPLLRQWAAAGYVVAAPSFPLSTQGASGGATFTDYANQPGDVSFVISQMVSLAADPGSPFSHLIDPSRIAVVGHSLGAVTALGLGYNSCCRDPRVKAVVAIAGTEAPFPKGAFFTAPAVPLLVIHGTADQTIAYQDGQRIFADARPPKFFVTLVGAPHSFPLVATQAEGPLPWEAVGVRSVLDFLDFVLDGRASGLAQLATDATVDGVAGLQSSRR